VNHFCPSSDTVDPWKNRSGVDLFFVALWYTLWLVIVLSVVVVVAIHMLRGDQPVVPNRARTMQSPSVHM
jgi:hypothetical protein